MYKWKKNMFGVCIIKPFDVNIKYLILHIAFQNRQTFKMSMLMWAQMGKIVGGRREGEEEIELVRGGGKGEKGRNMVSKQMDDRKASCVQTNH